MQTSPNSAEQNTQAISSPEVEQKPQAKKAQAIHDMAAPKETKKKNLKSFLGPVSYNEKK